MGACRPPFAFPFVPRFHFADDFTAYEPGQDLNGLGPWVATAQPSLFLVALGRVFVGAADGSPFSSKVLLAGTPAFRDNWSLGFGFTLGAEGDPFTAVGAVRISTGILGVSLSIVVDMTTRTGIVTAWGHASAPVVEIPSTPSTLTMTHRDGLVTVVLNGVTILTAYEAGTADEPDTITLTSSEDSTSMIDLNSVVFRELPQIGI